MVIPNAKDIGGFEVRRALPTAKRRLVGPFIFFDRMGPAILRAGQALDVRPHPHIGLSTVTYLFDGKIRHRDSLGTEMVIAPGDVNLMTAGRGIVHSERTPEELRGAPMSISGLQTWLALPDDKEEIAPVFANTGSAALPEFDADGVSGPRRHRRLRGHALAGADRLPTRSTPTSGWRPARSVKIPADAEERAIYMLDGEVVDLRRPFPGRPAAGVPARRRDRRLVANAARISCCSAAPRSARKRYIWWNFVSSSKERIEQAKEEWKTGRFDIVPGDEEEFIPLPEG